MCDPMTVAGLALSAGGSFLEAREANKNAQRVQNAKDQAFSAYQTRQDQFADESRQAFGKSKDKHSRDSFDEKKEADVDQRQQAFSKIKTQPDYNLGTAGSTPKNVILAREAASEEAADESQRDAGALFDLSSYGGALFDQGLDRNEFARLFGNIGSKAQADTRLLPNEINAAGNNAQKAPGAFPQLLKLGGQGLGMFGAGGGSFTNTIEGPMSTMGPGTAFGPGAPVTKYGLFNKGKPVQLFGSQLVY